MISKNILLLSYLLSSVPYAFLTLFFLRSLFYFEHPRTTILRDVLRYAFCFSSWMNFTKREIFDQGEVFSPMMNKKKRDLSISPETMMVIRISSLLSREEEQLNTNTNNNKESYA